MCGSQTLEQKAVKLKLPWRSQNVRDDRVMEYLLRKDANNPGERSLLQSTAMKGVGELNSVLTLDMKMQHLEFAQLAFGLEFVQYFPTMTF